MELYRETNSNIYYLSLRHSMDQHVYISLSYFFVKQSLLVDGIHIFYDQNLS